jgi:hypothetical protein
VYIDLQNLENSNYLKAPRDLRDSDMRQHGAFFFVLVWSVSAGGASLSAGRMQVNKLNPYFQKLPNCRDKFARISKKTTATALVCPMIRDETGFLSEWVTYYQIHGFDHIKFYDHGSKESYEEELGPWIKSGFVTIERNFSSSDYSNKGNKKEKKFMANMVMKVMQELHCKAWASEQGFNYFVSVDLDEYIVPQRPGITAVDELEHFFVTSKRSYLQISKYNFVSSPHILEPVNLLTIEAYQVFFVN